MQSSGAQPGNFRAYRVWRAPWVGRPGCTARCLVGVPPSGWAFRAKNGDVVGQGRE